MPAMETGDCVELEVGGAEAHGELAGEDGGDAAGIFGDLGGGLELIGEGARGGEGGGVLVGEAVLARSCGRGGLRGARAGT